MKVFNCVDTFRSWRQEMPANAIIPFVPTMGALHEGHASLVRRARQLADAPGGRGIVIASIFVNPTQFGPREDFARYPRTLDADAALLQAAGCDALLVPPVDEMYPPAGSFMDEPPGQKNAAAIPDAASQGQKMFTIDPGPMGDLLEGASDGGRPGHFRGVCTVVAKLLNITGPSQLLLGQKDFQQLAILRRMCADLNFPVEVIACPTLRESDGLAMSSRNRYLSAEERLRAPALFEALQRARDLLNQGERQAAKINAAMREHVMARGLLPVYALAADARSLLPLAHLPGPTSDGQVVLLIAARIGTTRLIDNLVL